MTLKHPLNPENEANKKAIEMYKDREVIIEHGLHSMWMGYNGWVQNKKEAQKMTFKESLKKTKNYPASSCIRYHFTSTLGEPGGLPITEFAPEDVYSCSTVKFDDNDDRRYKPRI